MLGIDEKEAKYPLHSRVVAHEIQGHGISQLINSEISEGIFTCIEMIHPENYGPPLHTHTKEDELFIVVQGEYKFQIGDKITEHKAGDIIFGPRNIKHTFMSKGNNGKTLVLTAPAGFEEYFPAVSKLPKENFPEALKELNKKFGISFVGSPLAKAKFWQS